MTDISITVGGNTFTFTSGSIEEVSANIISNAENEPIATSGPMGSYNYDYNGTTKTITIRGILRDEATTRVPTYSVNTAIEQREWLESVMNGAQTSMVFTSNYDTLSIIDSTSPSAPYMGRFTYTKVMFASARFTERAGMATHIEFEIMMLVGL